jgi:hypothetical protein
MAVQRAQSCSLVYALSQNANIGLSASRFWVHDYAGPVSVNNFDAQQSVEILPERNYTGWSGSLSAQMRF